MLKEKIFLIVIAIFGGILFSVGLFYLYQKTLVSVPQTQPVQAPSPKPEPPPFFLNIDSPQDEEVFEKRIVPLVGKTTPGATVVISLEDKEIVLTPSPEGDFSTNLTLFEGVNPIEIMAVTKEKTIREVRTVTFTTESF